MTIETIISGGQTGVDMGALIGAKQMGLRTGGTAPKKFMTEMGSNYELRRMFNLKELDVIDPKIYPMRSMRNVDDSDLTIGILLPDHKDIGTMCTLGYAQSKKWQFPKPGFWDCYKSFVGVQYGDLATAALQIKQFIGESKPKVVNFAGPRESSKPGIQAWTTQLIIHLKSIL